MTTPENLEAAAGTWLQRLYREEQLPSKSVLEILRRREASSRHRVEAWADAEHRCAQLATMRLEDERQLHAKRAEKNEELTSSLRVERQMRLDAEVALTRCQADLRCAKADLEAEQSRRNAAERAEGKAREEIQELRKLLDDDQSIQILGEFQEKLESQRSEISSLQQRLSVAQDATAAADAARCQSLQELDMTRDQTMKELDFTRREASKELQLVRSQASNELESVRSQLSKELELVRQQASKDLADMHASWKSTSDALALEQRERESLSNEIMQLREAGTTLQQAVEATLSAWMASIDRQDFAAADQNASSEMEAADEEGLALYTAAENVLSALQPFLLYQCSSALYEHCNFPDLGFPVPTPESCMA